MGPPGKRAFIQLLVVLLVSGALRAAYHRSAGPALLPGESASLDRLADSAARLAAAEARRARPLAQGELLDPNRAPEEELDRLPGVGPTTARALVTARDSLPFRSLDELVRVRGIGDRTAERLRQHLTLSSVPAVAPGGLRSGAAQGGDRRGLRRGDSRSVSVAADRVDVNRSTREELQALPGIGPVMADRIVAFRTRHGAFRTAEDLRAVSGIGPALLERLQGRIRFR